MNTVGPIQLPALPAVPRVAAVPAGNTPALPAPRIDAAPQPEAVDARLFDQKRFEVVQKAAEQIANANVLGSTTFVVFRDISGQAITRFRDTHTGKVTYIPEPDMLRKNGGSLVNTLA